MRGAVERGHLVIGLGDFNMIPSSLAHRLIETHGKVKDVWRTVHPDSSLGAFVDPVEKARGKPKPTIRLNLDKNGTTCDSSLNTWRWGKQKAKRLKQGEDVEINDHQHDPRAKRLDYVFLGTSHFATQSDWQVQEVNVGMTSRHPTLGVSLSDHFSVEATIATDQKSGVLDGQVKTREVHSLPLSTYDEILGMIVSYTQRERRQQKFRLWHFQGSILISVGCLIGVWWSPKNFVAFILMLLSTLSLSAGVIDGMIGGFFVATEIRALKEFDWEIRTARHHAASND